LTKAQFDHEPELCDEWTIQPFKPVSSVSSVDSYKLDEYITVLQNVSVMLQICLM